MIIIIKKVTKKNMKKGQKTWRFKEEEKILKKKIRIKIK